MAIKKKTKLVRVARKLARVWIFLIRKGGSAKTISSVNFAAALATQGRKVLFVDLDPQGNGTRHFGLRPGELTDTVNTLFTTIGVDPRSVIRTVSFTVNRKTYTLDVMPAKRDLDETDLSMKATQAGMFKPIIEALREDYDDIVIDTRPTRSLLTLSAMITATHAVVTMEAGVFALDALEDTLSDINEVRNGLNPQLKLVGILPTRVKEHTNLSRAILGDAADSYDHLLIRYVDKADGEQGTPKVLFIREGVHLGEAPAYGIPGIAWKLGENAAAHDYLKLAEVLHVQET